MSITLRAIHERDAEALASILNQPRVRWGTLRLPYRPTQSMGDWIRQHPAEDVRVLAEQQGTVLGFATLNRMKGRRIHVAELVIAVGDEHAGKGVGTQLMAALIDAADNWMNLKRIELTVYTDNAPAIALYEKFGFVHEGTHVAYAFRDGAYVDVYCMARVSA
ncbi:GNAT family N-acetyltransferase [Pseudomonas asuensis]|uniref:Acetyltransferase n=1 Tax=Pseudomonas asuensis TaxID=1825787 RepID=A0ABQ2GW23_9PSED|nr:GNAT family N-acetyltransferase [Pseudomonas asuensis]GGM13897.1 acetyltransferase [Pseudomonas asuensis]